MLCSRGGICAWNVENVRDQRSRQRFGGEGFERGSSYGATNFSCFEFFKNLPALAAVSLWLPCFDLRSSVRFNHVNIVSAVQILQAHLERSEVQGW